MMSKRTLSILLSLALVLSLVIIPVSAAPSTAPDTDPSAHWFYDQLTDGAKVIYDAIEAAFSNGKMVNGTYDIDLSENDAVSQASIKEYVDGNQTLFNDFAAAKDAFDLEHPEAWYIDSSYLSFRVTSDSDGRYHAYVGAGRGPTYYVAGVNGEEDVAARTKELETAINDIVKSAENLKTTLEQVRFVHKSVTESISYRFEYDCDKENPIEAGCIRTAYALVTHKGVCESYSRSFQYALQKLGIPCVLIHGTQYSGEPEAHMWTAVRMPVPTEGDAVPAAESEEWYVVDPTWDDPIPLDADGNVKPGNNGADGAEHEKYFLVGEDVLAGAWQPSGNVSTGAFKFTYPSISSRSYFSREKASQDLKVTSEKSTMDGEVSTVYHISYKGKGILKSAEEGYYFLIKMSNVHMDGTISSFDTWYYPEFALEYQGSRDFKDTDDYMVLNVSHCEYVEFAITTRTPDFYATGKPNDAYYSGDFSDIVVESGLIFNENGRYEAPPYVCNVYPDMTRNVAVGEDYRCHVEFTQDLYRPTDADLAEFAGTENDIASALAQTTGVDFMGYNYNWSFHEASGGIHEFAARPEIKNLTYLFSCDKEHEHSIDTCDIYGVEFNFAPSVMWADDSVLYQFTLYGFVGRASNKLPGGWGYVYSNGSCACCYRSQGIDWNMWGQPAILDNVGDLDFDKMVLEGVDGNEMTLEELCEQMNLDPYDMNGRLILAVEPLGDSRSDSDEISDAISESEDVDVDPMDIISSMLYEIDFVRMCGKTIVETGQSVRISMGFPAGFDASSLGEFTFKVYHFTRDIEGSCPTPDDPNHVHTGEIISVEEIPVTVTPYGLVIVVEHFSPFEIVAVNNDSALAMATAEKDHTLIAASNGNGHITYEEGGKTVTAVGADGMISFSEGQSRTFTICPEEGYVLDSVIFSGGEVTVEGNTFTLSYDKVADGSLLSVSFIASTVVEAEAERGEDPVTITVCTHDVTEGGVVTPATCTTDGSITEKVCKVCGQVLSQRQVIPAKGHLYKNGFCTVCGSADGQDVVLPFTDTHEVDSWYLEHIKFVYRRGLMRGRGNGIFDPYANISRAEVWTVLYHIENSSDLTMDEGDEFWFDPYKDWAVEKGITDGSRPFAPATREEIVVMLYLYNGVSAASDVSLEDFDDFEDISPEAYDAWIWAIENGVIVGYGDNTLHPQDNVRRSESASILHSYLEPAV